MKIQNFRQMFSKIDLVFFKIRKKLEKLEKIGLVFFKIKKIRKIRKRLKDIPNTFIYARKYYDNRCNYC